MRRRLTLVEWLFGKPSRAARRRHERLRPRRHRAAFQPLEPRHLLTTISINDVTLDEADSGTVNAVFTVTLSQAQGTDVTVGYATANGTAAAPGDYTSTSGNLVFLAGQVTKTISVPVAADTVQEADETFYVNLTPPGGITGDTQGLGTIRDASTFTPNPVSEENPTLSDSSIDRFGGGFRSTLPLAGKEDFLVYNSNTNDRPLIVVETAVKSGMLVPLRIEAQLKFNGVAGSTVYYSTTGLSAGTSVRFVLQADATGLATARYGWEAIITGVYSGSSYSRKFFGEQNVVNSASSELGSRWRVEELDRVHAGTGGVMLVKGDGAALWYSDAGGGNYTRPAEDTDFATMVKLGDNSYRRTDKYGRQQNFSTVGLLTSRADSNGNTKTYVYTDADSDGVDDLWKITDAVGRITTLTYAGGFLDYIDDFDGRRTEVTISSGKMTSYALPDPDAGGPLSAPTITLSNAGPGGLMSQTTDPIGRSTGLEYDFAHRANTATNPDTTTWEITAAQTRGLVDTSGGVGASSGNPAPWFNPNMAYAPATDPRGNESTLTFNRFGDTLNETQPLNSVTTLERNIHGLVTRRVDPDPDGAGSLTSPITEATYDTRGNVTLLTLPDDSERSWTYDTTFSRVTSATDELGRQEIYTVSPTNGNVTAIREVIGLADTPQNGETNDLVTTYTYLTGTGLAGLVDTETDPLGRITDWDYSGRGLVTKITYAKGTADEAFVTYEYNTADMPTAFVDELGRRTEFQYDKLDRMTRRTESDPDGAGGPLTSPVWQWEYSPADQVTKGGGSTWERDDLDLREFRPPDRHAGAGPRRQRPVDGDHDRTGSQLEHDQPYRQSWQGDHP